MVKLREKPYQIRKVSNSWNVTVPQRFLEQTGARLGQRFTAYLDGQDIIRYLPEKDRPSSQWMGLKTYRLRVHTAGANQQVLEFTVPTAAVTFWRLADGGKVHTYYQGRQFVISVRGDLNVVEEGARAAAV